MSPLRIALFFVLFGLVLVLASLTAPPSEWRESVRWAEARLAQLEAEAPTCPVLAGQPVASSARARYEATLRLVGRVDADLEERLRQLAAGAGPEADEHPLELVARLPSAARAELSHAVRAAGGVFARETFGTKGGDFAWYELLPLFDGLLVEARFERDEDARVRAWLDALACAVDIAGHEAVAVGAVGVLMVTWGVAAATEQWLDGLSSSSLAVLGDALAKADRGFPAEAHWAAVAVAFVCMVEAGVELDAHDLGMRTRLQAWRHGFSLDGAAVARAQGLADAVQEFEAATRPGDGWLVRRPALRALEQRDVQQTSNVAFRDLGPVVGIESERRKAKAQLGLLRLAVALRRGLEAPAIPDPLGDGLLVVEADGERLRCRSREPGVERSVAR